MVMTEVVMYSNSHDVGGYAMVIVVTIIMFMVVECSW